MENISPRKSLKRANDPIDEWLANEGYVRKHAPRDPTCLFRAISEQVYLTQYYHIRVREECVNYMRKNNKLFQKSMNIPLENYLEQMSCFTEWGSVNEIHAMSLLYKREVVVYNGQKMTKSSITENGFKDTIYLCHNPPKLYESIYAKESIASAAFCQSLVYKTLYEEVFKVPNVDNIVHQMLHDKATNYRHDKFFHKENMEIRDKLAVELITDIEKGREKPKEEKIIARGYTPFPYKVAKALDPNIYRNTDFDIWHEIRREVKSAGWNKWNNSELQVGGKCLVQVDFKEEKLETINNNNNKSVNGETDSNGNTSKDCVRVGKREPAFLFGHIQAMSKDKGPVVVFIEELGEKKTLPFDAIKPLGCRRFKQNYYCPSTTGRRHVTESTHKWRKTWNTLKKTREPASNYVSKNTVDRNNNNDGKTKDNRKDRWNDESNDQKKTPALTNYSMDTYNSCQGFPAESVIDVMPVTVHLDNANPTLAPNVPQNNEDYNKNPPQGAKNPGNNDSVDRSSPNVGSLPPESLIPPPQQLTFQSSQETFYPHQIGSPSLFPGNPNMPCVSPDGNSFPMPVSCFQVQPPAPGSLMDRTIRAIYFSAASNFDPNNSDLPDMVTLRFFYYLGLQCFRAGYAVVLGPNGQPMVLGPNCVPSMNSPLPNTPPEYPQASNPNEEEVSRPRQNFTPTRRRNDQSSGPTKSNNTPQQLSKTFTNRKIDMQEPIIKPLEGTRGESSKIVGDMNRPPMHTNSRRTGGGPPHRFKKNVENHNQNRNMAGPPSYQQDHHQPQHPQQQQQQQQQQQPNYQHGSGLLETPNFQGIKSEPSQQQQVHSMPLMPPCQQQSSPPGGISGAFPTPYGPPTIYTAMPYYPGDGETFYAPGPSFYPVNYVSHPEISETNNGTGFPTHIYQPGGENYGQPMPSVHPSFIYPQQTVYPGLSQQMGQENWYPMQAQPQFLQYPHCSPSQSPPNQNNSQSP